MKIPFGIVLALLASSATGFMSKKPKAEKNGGLVDQARDLAATGMAHMKTFWEGTVVPQIQQGVTHVRDEVREIQWNELPEIAKQSFKEKAADAHEKFIAIKLEDVPEKIKQYIKEHPCQTALYVAEGVLFISPGGVAAPLFRLLGFTPLGPQAGTLATKMFSVLGPVRAKSIVATIQSSQMSGYGLAAVNMVGRAAAAVGGGLTGTWDYWRPAAWREEDGEDKAKKIKAKS